MKLVKKEKSIERKNSEICVVSEYHTDHQHLDFAIVNISGKYPESGFAMNLISSEVIYVQNGKGAVTVNGSIYHVNSGDVILIEPNEQFVWEGNLQLHIVCHPAFNPEQHVVVADL